MRATFLTLPLAILAAPAIAQKPPAAPIDAGQVRIPPELTDPAFIDRLTDMTQALSKALLDLPVGEIEAAVEGRPASRADRRRTLRDSAKINEREIERSIAEARPRIQAAMKALSSALPAMTEALSKAADEVERATANVPRPGYPRR